MRAGGGRGGGGEKGYILIPILPEYSCIRVLDHFYSYYEYSLAYLVFNTHLSNCLGINKLIGKELLSSLYSKKL